MKNRGWSTQNMALISRLSKTAVLVLLLSSTFLLSPKPAEAGLFSSLMDFIDSLKTDSQIASAYTPVTSPVLEAAINMDPSPIKTEFDVQLVGEDAILAESGPGGSVAETSNLLENNGQISVYTIHKGDTLTGIAKMFDVSPNTILWANDINNPKTLTVGQTIVILPISGVKYAVKKGDTIASIAKKYRGDVKEITDYNNLSENQKLAVGDIVIIPDGEIAGVTYTAVAGAASNPTSALRGVYGLPNYSGYYIKPVACRKTQGLHGYNGLDFGCPLNTSISAAAGGTILIAKTSGWNGGYGNYILMQHSNGTYTLYGHLTRPIVSVGQIVAQGEVIGYTGNTGKSTGPHLHFEVRGAKNPF